MKHNMALFSVCVFFSLLYLSTRLSPTTSASPLGTSPNPFNMRLVSELHGVSITAVAVQGTYAYGGLSYDNGTHFLAVWDISNPTTPTLLEANLQLPDAIGKIRIIGNYAYLASNTAGLYIVTLELGHPLLTGHYDAPGTVTDVAVASSYAYLAERDLGLRIVDISQPTYPIEVGFYDSPDKARHVAVTGHYVYLADADHGSLGQLEIIDVSNPTIPVRAFRGSFGNGTVYDIAIQGNYAYIATKEDWWGYPGFEILDISNPVAPVLVGALYSYDYLTSVTTDIEIVGNYAYMTDPIGSQLHIINITDPTSPTLVAKPNFPGSEGDMVVGGSYLYLASNDGGLRILDITNPPSPAQIGVSDQDVPNTPQHLLIANNLAYVAGHYNFQILSLDSPSNPMILGSAPLPRDDFSFPFGFPTTDILLTGTHAYLANNGGGLRVFDVETPVAPTETASYLGITPHLVKTSGGYTYLADGQRGGIQILDTSTAFRPVEFVQTEPVKDLELSGNYLFATTYSSLSIIDITAPTQPDIIGSYSSPSPLDTVISGNHAYLLDWSSGLHIVDISDPTQPVAVSTYPIYGNYLAIFGAYLYISNNSFIEILDVSDPSQPTSAGQIYIGEFNNLRIEGNRLLVWWAETFTIYDLSNPTQPLPLGSYSETPTWGWYLEVEGNYVYISDLNEGLDIVDISNPSAPTLVSTYDLLGWWASMDVIGTDIYMTNATEGVYWFSAVNPSLPVLVGSYQQAQTVTGVAVWGDYVLLTAENDGLRVIEMGDYSQMQEVGFYDTPGEAHQVVVTGSLAYVADGAAGGLQILDLSDPTAPVMVGEYDTSGEAKDVIVVDDHAYVANGIEGVQIFDVSNPANPVQIGFYDTAVSATQLVINGRYLSVADGEGGVLLLDITHPAQPLLLGSYDLPGEALSVATTNNYLLSANGSAGMYILEVTAASATLTPEQGGTLVYTDTHGSPTHLEIAPGAVTTTTTLVYAAYPAITLGANSAVYTHIFRLTPYQNGLAQPDLTFQQPVTLTIHYPTADVAFITDENQITLQWEQGDGWVNAATSCNPPAPFTLDTANNVIQTAVCGIGRYALFGPSHQTILPIILK